MRLDRAAVSDFERLVGARDYPCLGARSVLQRERATVHAYPRMGSATSTTQLLSDIAQFGHHLDLTEGFASFVAVFPYDECSDEHEFERLLWQQLQAIHEADSAPWDPTVSRDPQDPRFSFSAGGRAYFVIGLHPGASRPARRAPHPMLVFNPHEQFEMMRRNGRYDRMRDINRRRDEATHGSINPMMADHGNESEARQYSGRCVADDWRAPFTSRASSTRRD